MMDSLRLRYENGRFTPLDPIPELGEGEEIKVMAWTYSTQEETIEEMLDRTRGAWADWPEIEDLLSDAQKKWTQAWHSSQSSS